MVVSAKVTTTSDIYFPSEKIAPLTHRLECTLENKVLTCIAASQDHASAIKGFESFYSTVLTVSKEKIKIACDASNFTCQT